MIDYETYCQIKHASQQQQLRASQIAAALQIDLRTVEKWLKAEKYQPKAASARSSKLDDYKDAIVRRLEAHPYSATQIFQQMKEQGYEGGYTILKDYVRKVRPHRAPAFLTLSFAPGESAQVDWGMYGSVNVGNTRRRLSFFVMVLCYSRMMYVEFTLLQTMEHFLACHQHAFEAFNGVLENIMVDNIKSAVLKRVMGEPVFNPRYVDFARHHGFTIKPCNVRKGNEKGRVESGVGYVKKNFLNGLDIADFSHVNPAMKTWLDTIANVRLHGETHKRPIDLFDEERAKLQPLPGASYDIGVIHHLSASNRFRVVLGTNRYSVPSEYASQPLILKAYPDRLCIYHHDKLIARHARCYDRRRDFELPDHPRELLQQRTKGREQKLLARFLTLSPRAEQYYKELEQRRLNPRHHIRHIVALSEIYSVDAVARAMEDAFTFQAFSCEYIANLLEQRARIQQPPVGALHLTRSEDLLELEIDSPNLDDYASSLDESDKETLP